MSKLSNMNEDASSVSDIGKVPLVLVIMQILTAVAIVIENVLLICTIYRNSDLHATSYFFIASLGVTDLLVGLLSLVGSIYYLVLFYPSGGVTSLATTIYICLTTGITMLSCIHMAVISLERYAYIVHPFWYQRRMTPSLIRNVLAGLWLFGIGYVGSLCIAQTKISYIRVLFECDTGIRVVAVASLYILATGVTGLSYVFILRFVHNLGRTVGSSWVSAGGAPIGQVNGQRNCQVNGQIVPRSWRAPARSLKFFVSAFGLYLLMTCPSMLDMFLHQHIQTSQDARLAFLAFLVYNSGINFIVLVKVDRKFRVILIREIRNLMSKLSGLVF